MEQINTKVHEKVALSPETFARAEKLAARHGEGIRDFIPQLVAEKVEELKAESRKKIISNYTFDSSLYWDICDLVDGRMPTDRFLGEFIEEIINEKWKGIE